MNKPVIGLTASHDLLTDDLKMGHFYIDAIRKNGAIPLVLPLTLDEEEAGQLADTLDGFLFSGGPDVHPFLVKRHWPAAEIFHRCATLLSCCCFPRFTKGKSRFLASAGEPSSLISPLAEISTRTFFHSFQDAFRLPTGSRLTQRIRPTG